MIAFEVALMMEPMTMMGACAGVLLNKIFPGWLITLMLVAVLGLTTQRTLQKGIAAWRKETAAAAISAAQPESGAALLSRADKATMGAETPADQAPLARACEAATALDAALADDLRSPIRDTLALLAAMAATFLVSYLRGPNHHQSPLGIHCGSTPYWASVALQLVALVAFSAATRSVLLGRQARREACSYPFLPDDVQWNGRSSILYPLACALAGLCAGLFGIGGGIVKGPLMLEMGMLPQVSQAPPRTPLLVSPRPLSPPPIRRPTRRHLLPPPAIPALLICDANV